jgi:hypothetical protein
MQLDADRSSPTKLNASLVVNIKFQAKVFIKRGIIYNNYRTLKPVISGSLQRMLLNKIIVYMPWNRKRTLMANG